MADAFQQPMQNERGEWVTAFQVITWAVQFGAFQGLAFVAPPFYGYPTQGVGATGDPLNLRRNR